MASTEKDAETIAFARTLSNTPWCEDYEKMISGVLYGQHHSICSPLTYKPQPH